MRFPKALVPLALFAACACLPLAGQDANANVNTNVNAMTSAACGPLPVHLSVKRAKPQHGLAQPEPGKALVYFIQDAGRTVHIGYPTTRIGIDGKWVGANKINSAFFVILTPGEHHLCVAIQSSFVHNDIELAHLRAEAGKVYYYRTRMNLSISGTGYLSMRPVDSDEGRYLVERFPETVLRTRGKKPKK